MEDIIRMYITLTPVIISGMLNMIFCKYKFMKVLDFPIDNYRCMKDGKRIFGDNKTWNGFFGYLMINALVYIIWGEISNHSQFLNGNNYFYINFDNKFCYNINIGILLGLAYAI